jgi:hypothetical protein
MPRRTRNNYERYTTLAKDAARRGETIEAEPGVSSGVVRLKRVVSMVCQRRS